MEPGQPYTWPWPWVLGTAVVTSAIWGLTLQSTGYGHASAPDLHGYRLAGSPCAGYNLKPLTDAFRTSRFFASPADIRTGSALSQAQCVITAEAPVRDHWKNSYTVTVTVELHKKTDPTAEFEDRNRPNGPNLDSSVLVPGTDETDQVFPVDHLGDEAYLLTGNAQEQALTVRHGGAVFTIDLAATEQWTGDDIPSDAYGYPQQMPSLDRFHPALTEGMRRLMGALSP
ncbi:hypothetical protein OG552_35435 [Streptomyces sp. NBC_01476]|uniref:hypothetical protein n=1 Tax=Streptomyces sp. NBC_01476 TaxID=2903881 RepID=UPI002E36DC01|nr:hypothetical protein [Streptomyces sp. NBC_01476]